MKYLFFSCCICIAQLAQAQRGAILPSWHAGIKGDLNYSNISGNGMASGYMSGGQAGAFAEYVFSSGWAVQPELLYTQSNTKKNETFMTYYNVSGNPFGAEDIKLAYLSLPVLLKYNINKSFSLMAGPQYSLMLVDAESLLNSGDGKAFKRYELSGNVGAQFNIGRVGLYGRYNQGFTNINNIDNRYSWRSSHIQAGMAVRII